MGNFIETTYPTIEERVKWWQDFGLLERINDNEIKKLVAMALDAAAICITELNYKNFRSETKTAILPVIVRIFRETEKSFDFESLLKTVKFIIGDFGKKYEKETFDTDSDDSAEFVYQYCKDFSFNNKVHIIEL